MNKANPLFYGTIHNGKLDFPQSEKDKLNLWLESFSDGVELEIEIKKLTDTRTLSQNNAIHKYYELVAEALNNAGLTIEKVIENFTMEHQWTKGSVKELLWREAQRSVLGKESTTELSKLEDIDKVYDIVNRFLAKLKVESIPFPSIENSELTIKNQ